MISAASRRCVETETRYFEGRGQDPHGPEGESSGEKGKEKDELPNPTEEKAMQVKHREAVKGTKSQRGGVKRKKKQKGYTEKHRKCTDGKTHLS